jgi:hypothetical protein
VVSSSCVTTRMGHPGWGRSAFLPATTRDLLAMTRSKDPQLPGFNRGAGEGTSRPRRSRGAGCKWRCYSCGELFSYQTGKKGFETHADTVAHYRFEVVFA